MLINRETINRNNSVRPPEKSFFEDMIKTEQKDIIPIEHNIIKSYPKSLQ